jgi:hypothetical protein
MASLYVAVSRGTEFARTGLLWSVRWPVTTLHTANIALLPRSLSHQTRPFMASSIRFTMDRAQYGCVFTCSRLRAEPRELAEKFFLMPFVRHLAAKGVR